MSSEAVDILISLISVTESGPSMASTDRESLGLRINLLKMRESFCCDGTVEHVACIYFVPLKVSNSNTITRIMTSEES